jgi:hypothetical protein
MDAPMMHEAPKSASLSCLQERRVYQKSRLINEGGRSGDIHSIFLIPA